MEDGQLAQAEPSCGEKIVLSINSGTDQEKCVWLKVVEAEGLMILVNDNVVRKWRVSRRKMLGSICLSAWKSTKYFFPARREFSVRPARTEREGKLLPVGANLRSDPNGVTCTIFSPKVHQNLLFSRPHQLIIPAPPANVYYLFPGASVVSMSRAVTSIFSFWLLRSTTNSQVACCANSKFRSGNLEAFSPLTSSRLSPLRRPDSYAGVCGKTSAMSFGLGCLP